MSGGCDCRGALCRDAVSRSESGLGGRECCRDQRIVDRKFAAPLISEPAQIPNFEYASLAARITWSSIAFSRSTFASAYSGDVIIERNAARDG